MNEENRIDQEEMKKIEIEILKSFTSFCEKYNLRYFLACGTLLGAIKYNGFIPWDDDIDVYMPRKDYMKFLEIAGTTLEKNYRILSPYTLKNYIYTYIKIIDTRTILIEFPDTIRYKIGIYIDIFPVDGLPDSLEKSDKHFFIIRRLISRNWLFNVRFRIFKKDHRFHVRLYGYLINLLGKIIRKDFFFKKLDKKARSLEYDNCKYVALITAGYGNRERILRNCFDTYYKVKFENNFYNAPLCAHEYLSNLYGDYLNQLPPEKERIKRHDNECYWKL